MANALLLDTHIVLWLDSGNERLRSGTRALVDRCWRGGGVIYTSAVTVWEIALLVNLGRVGLDAPVPVWMERWLARPGFAAVSLSHRAAAQSYALPGFGHRDPADRLLIATAVELGCPLVTYDARIFSFARRHGRDLGLEVAR